MIFFEKTVLFDNENFSIFNSFREVPGKTFTLKLIPEKSSQFVRHPQNTLFEFTQKKYFSINLDFSDFRQNCVINDSQTICIQQIKSTLTTRIFMKLETNFSRCTHCNI